MYWKRVDELHSLPHLVGDHEVHFAREFMIGGGYSASETNQLIFNFKKPGSKRNTAEWHYRERAIEQFANELRPLLDGHECCLVAIPESRSKASPDYTNRFEDLFERLSPLLPSATFEWPIRVRAEQLAAHAGGPRDPDLLARNYEWVGFANPPKTFVVVVDDVLTSGGHYQAVRSVLRTHGYGGPLVGVFWARSVR